MKKFLLALALLLVPATVKAVTTAQVNNVRISTGTLARQSGIAVISGIDISSNAVINSTTFYQNGTIVTASTITFNGGGIKGMTSGAYPAAGFIAEISSVTISVATNAGSTGVYGDLATMTLSAGNWDISAAFIANQNSAASVSEVSGGVSTTSGNSGTGLVEPANSMTITGAVCASNVLAFAIPPFPVSISGSTTYYLKYKATYTGSTPQFKGYIFARRRI